MNVFFSKESLNIILLVRLDFVHLLLDFREFFSKIQRAVSAWIRGLKKIKIINRLTLALFMEATVGRRYFEATCIPF